MARRKECKLDGLDTVMSKEVKSERFRELVYLLRRDQDYGVLIDSPDRMVVYAPFYGDNGILQARKSAEGVKSVVCWTDRLTALSRYNELVMQHESREIRRLYSNSPETNIVRHPSLRALAQTD